MYTEVVKYTDVALETHSGACRGFLKRFYCIYVLVPYTCIYVFYWYHTRVYMCFNYCTGTIHVCIYVLIIVLVPHTCVYLYIDFVLKCTYTM